MNTTTNVGLSKPSITDKFVDSLAGFNSNCDKLDKDQIQNIISVTTAGGTWTVRKWYSGYCEAFCAYAANTLALPQTSTQVNGFYRGVTQLNLSSIFNSITAGTVSYASNGLYTCTVNGTNNKILELVRWCASNVASAQNDGPVGFYVVGRWKA